MPQQIYDQNLSSKKCDTPRTCARQARLILKKAGYHYQTGKLFSPDNQEVTFEILNHSPAMERVLLPMAATMKKIGITATIRTMDSAQYIRRLNQFDYDAMVGVWAQSSSPGNEQREYWSTKAAQRTASRNYAGLQDPLIDEVIEKLIFSKNRQELVVACKVLDRLLQIHQFAIPMWYAPAERVAYWDKFGLPPQVQSYGAAKSILFWWKK